MHRSRTLILLGLLVVLPVIAAVVAARFLLPDDDVPPVLGRTQPQPVEAPRPPVTRRVVVTTRELSVGSLLGEGDLTALDLEDDKIRREHIVVRGTETFGELRGHAMRTALPPGEPLTRSDVIGPGQRGFLAAVLRPGTRAVTIELGKGARHAGLIDPGDRVDVILTAKLRLPEGASTVFTRTILEDVRVVAVDRRIETGVAPEEGEKVKRKEIVTATLEVSPVQADRLALGEHEGSLSVAVRSLAGAGAPARGEAVDLQQLLSSPAPEAAGKPDGEKIAVKPSGAGLAPWKKVRVYRGSAVTELKFADPARAAAGRPGTQ